MNKFFSTLSILTLFFSFYEIAIADDYFAITKPGDGNLNIFSYNTTSGKSTLLQTHCAQSWSEFGGNRCSGNISDMHISNEGNLVWSETNRKKDGIDLSSKIYSYNRDTNAISELGTPWKSNYQGTYEIQLLEQKSDGSIQIGSDANDIDVVADGLNIDGTAVITKNADGSIQIGADGNDIDITAEGLNVDGKSLITQKENGEIHIGENSLITKKKEVTLPDGRKVQPLYAEDEDDNRIPINIDGSKLLIDGVEVIAGGDNAQITTNKNNISTNKANIKNLGEGVAGSTALTAALSALPQTSKESKLSCGVGTGAYSSRYAVGFGCASKVNERVDINAGGSYVFGGSKSYGGGTLDSGVVKAGFVFKLGELKKPIQISMKDKKKMETKIGTLTEKNEKLQNTVSTLIARLEILEKIASRDIKSKDLASTKN